MMVRIAMLTGIAMMGLLLSPVVPAQAQRPSDCTAAALSATSAWDAGAGSRFVTITLTNQSSEPCRLRGRPGLELLDQGQPLPVPQTPGTETLHTALTGASALRLLPGEQAEVAGK